MDAYSIELKEVHLSDQILHNKHISNCRLGGIKRATGKIFDQVTRGKYLKLIEMI